MTAAGIWVPRYIVEVPGSRQGRALSPSSTAYLKPVGGGGFAKGEGGTPPKKGLGWESDYFPDKWLGAEGMTCMASTYLQTCVMTEVTDCL